MLLLVIDKRSVACCVTVWEHDDTAFIKCYTLFSTPYPLHPTLYTLLPISFFTLHPTSY